MLTFQTFWRLSVWCVCGVHNYPSYLSDIAILLVRAWAAGGGLWVCWDRLKGFFITCLRSGLFGGSLDDSDRCRTTGAGDTEAAGSVTQHAKTTLTMRIHRAVVVSVFTVLPCILDIVVAVLFTHVSRLDSTTM